MLFEKIKDVKLWLCTLWQVSDSYKISMEYIKDYLITIIGKDVLTPWEQ